MFKLPPVEYSEEEASKVHLPIVLGEIELPVVESESGQYNNYKEKVEINAVKRTIWERGKDILKEVKSESFCYRLEYKPHSLNDDPDVNVALYHLDGARASNNHYNQNVFRFAIMAFRGDSTLFYKGRYSDLGDGKICQTVRRVR